MTHPLNPLSEDEIKRSAKACQGFRSFPTTGSIRFVSTSLREPMKEEMIAFNKGSPAPAREADVCLLHNPKGTVYEAVVCLNVDEGDEVTQWHELPQGTQPQITLGEAEEAEATVLQDSHFQKRVKELFNVEDTSRICVDPWTLGNFGFDDEQGRRLMQCFLYLRGTHADENQYARPLEGLVPVVDLNAMQIFKYEEYDHIAPVPPETASYSADSLPDDYFRKDLKPINITQPEGVSFTVQGRKVEWQKWSFRVGFNFREGLTLHDVRYQGRPILYRASLAEMVVPYSDPRPPHRRKNALDVSEYGIGNLVNSLKLGCDCQGEIHYFDAVLNDDKGEPRRLENAICMHEEDTGVLWKHTEFRSNKAVTRRGRRLVLSSIHTVVNYEYACEWSFHLDGKINFAMKHTGQLNTTGWDEEAWGENPFGTIVLPNLLAGYHGHFYCMRLDFDVDGTENNVEEVNVQRATNKEAAQFLTDGHKHDGNAFVANTTRLRNEGEAAREANVASSRFWKIVSASQTNRLGRPTAYKLVPEGAALPFASSDSSILKRVSFPTKTLWVTKFNDGEFFPCGKYPNQSLAESDGLQEYLSNDRALENADSVCWYCFGITHLPQPEDFPVMPVVVAGFGIHPSGFFDTNPSNDVPPSIDHASKAASSCSG